jgi:hypothetical protein
MADIFISHAVADKALVDKFVGFLKEAIGVPAKSIFCSSVDGQGIPLGDDFNEYMKSKIQNPRLVILLMTPRYMESQFCLMELGATWAKSLNAIPIVVPPIKFNVISSTLGLKQGWSIADHAKLVDLRDKIRSLSINLEHRTEHDWDKKRAVWKIDLNKLLKNLASATSVSAADHAAVQGELSSVKEELAALQAAYEDATDTIEELKAVKDAVAVKAIMAKKGGFDAETRFNELLETISELRPPISLYFYRNMIMDLYNKSIAIDWYDQDQKSSAERAIQYNIMEPDHPYAYLWNGKKLKKISAAVGALDEFLKSEEATEFVKEQELEGHPMDTEDLEFWEYHLT